MKVIYWKGKGLKKMHARCHKMHTSPAEMYPICINVYLYMYNQTKNKFHCVLSRRTSSLKKRYQFLQTLSHQQSSECLNLQFFNSLHGFEAFVVHSGLTSPHLSTSHPQSATTMDCSFNGVLFDQI